MPDHNETKIKQSRGLWDTDNGSEVCGVGIPDEE